MKPHKHADLIKAWADGAEVEVLQDGEWVAVSDLFWSRFNEYRTKPQKWEPKGGRYFVSQSGFVHNDDSTDECREFGMEFETEEAAEKAAIAYRRYHRLYKLAEELSEGWMPDWDNPEQIKYSIYYEHESRKYKLTSRNSSEPICGVCFKDKEIAIHALEIIEAGGLE